MNKLGFGFLRLPQKDGETDFEKLVKIARLYLDRGSFYLKNRK